MYTSFLQLLTWPPWIEIFGFLGKSSQSVTYFFVFSIDLHCFTENCLCNFQGSTKNSQSDSREKEIWPNSIYVCVSWQLSSRQLWLHKLRHLPIHLKVILLIPFFFLSLILVLDFLAILSFIGFFYRKIDIVQVFQ